MRAQQSALVVGRMIDVDDDEANAILELRIQRHHALGLAIGVPAMRRPEEHQRGARRTVDPVLETIAGDREATTGIVGEAPSIAQKIIVANADQQSNLNGVKGWRPSTRMYKLRPGVELMLFVREEASQQ